MPTVLEQAKRGNPEAIAALMNHHLRSRHIQATALRAGGSLMVTLVANPVPQQQQMATFVYRGLSNLQPEGIDCLIVKAVTPVAHQLAWEVTLPLTVVAPQSAQDQTTGLDQTTALDQTTGTIAKAVPAATAAIPESPPTASAASSSEMPTATVVLSPQDSLSQAANTQPPSPPAKATSPQHNPANLGGGETLDATDGAVMPPITAKNWWRHPTTQPYLLLGLAASFAVLLWQTFGLVVLLLLLAVATIPARVAWGRGYQFFHWYLYSFALPAIALFHAMALPKRQPSHGATLPKVANRTSTISTSASEIPAISTSASGTPASGTPASGTPASEIPASEIPASDTSPDKTQAAEGTSPASPPHHFAHQAWVGADFSTRDLRAANFVGADLSGANFGQADCSGANFSQAKIGGANFRGANLSQANFTEATVAWQNSWITATCRGLPTWAWVVGLMLALNLLSLSLSLRYSYFAEYVLVALSGTIALVVGMVMITVQNPRQPKLCRQLTLALIALMTLTSLGSWMNAPRLTLLKLGLIVLAGTLTLVQNPSVKSARWGLGLGILGGLCLVNGWSWFGVGESSSRPGTAVILYVLVLGSTAIAGQLTAMLAKFWFTTFESATLKQANFTRANFSRTNFFKADTTAVIWQHTKLTGAIRPNGQRLHK